MFPMSKGWMMVSAFGHGVLFSLALSGGVRIVGGLLDMQGTERVAGNVFMIGSLTLGSLFVRLYTRSLKPAALEGCEPGEMGARD